MQLSSNMGLPGFVTESLRAETARVGGWGWAGVQGRKESCLGRGSWVEVRKALRTRGDQASWSSRLSFSSPCRTTRFCHQIIAHRPIKSCLFTQIRQVARSKPALTKGRRSQETHPAGLKSRKPSSLDCLLFSRLLWTGRPGLEAGKRIDIPSGPFSLLLSHFPLRRVTNERRDEGKTRRSIARSSFQGSSRCRFLKAEP